MVFGQIAINYWAVFAAAFASVILGSLWYGPVFGKIWIRLSKFTVADMKKAQKEGMTKSYILTFLGSLLTACVLAHFVMYLGLFTAVDALRLALLVWLGFVVPLLLGSVLWEGKSWKLYWINVAYHLVNLSVMSIILTLWI